MDTAFDAHKQQSDSKQKQIDALRGRVGMQRAQQSGTPYAPKFPKKQGAEEGEEIREGEMIVDIPLDLLVSNPFQPRLHMDPDAIVELATQIKKFGQLQPIVVHQLNDGKYMIQFGHRRVEACKKLPELKTVKAVIRESVGKDVLIGSSLIENIGREDMPIIDTAIAFENAIQQGVFKSKEELGSFLGMSRTQVSKIISLLKLPDDILKDLAVNKTITDRVTLEMLRTVNDETIIRQVYDWYVAQAKKPSRVEVKEKIDSLTSKKPVPAYTIKSTGQGCTIKLPVLSEEQEAKVSAFIKELMGEK